MKLERSYFTLGTHSTRSGMVDYLFEKRPRFLIVDEIEHMSIRDQTVLLSLMETGIIAETKFMKTRNTQLKHGFLPLQMGPTTCYSVLLVVYCILNNTS